MRALQLRTSPLFANEQRQKGVEDVDFDNVYGFINGECTACTIRKTEACAMLVRFCARAGMAMLREPTRNYDDESTQSSAASIEVPHDHYTLFFRSLK